MTSWSPSLRAGISGHSDRRLMSAQTPEVYRTADARFDNLPGYDFAPNYLDVDGLRMHYLDEGPPTARRWCAFTASRAGLTCTA
jgi:hypothetical protein